MPNYYLAIDIGASSGRHILFWLEDGKMQIQEVYRFPNGMIEKNGHLCWDADALEAHILAGMKRCGELGKIPLSVGIDTWGVDFVLLDENDVMLGDMVGYRDHRTDGMDAEVSQIISPEALYARTGIQKAIYNTIYQLMAVKKTQSDLLERAKIFLTVPDYFHFRLCGVKANEYTEATTTQLLDPQTRTWDLSLIEKLGLPTSIFQRIVHPATKLGDLMDAVAEKIGYRCAVVLPATHDTASAILAMPSDDPDAVYISSGTWSLLGVELAQADCGERSRVANFTNEGGFDGKICYLKNIMGLWMIQSVKKELATQGVDLLYSELCEQAEVADIASRIDCDDERFLSPKNMIAEIQSACAETGQAIPQTAGELARVVYRSLAMCYADAVEKLRISRGKDYRALSILSGGSNADYLNRLTAEETGCTVFVGPSEATAIGNAVAQMLSMDELHSLSSSKRCTAASFPVSRFKAEVKE